MHSFTERADRQLAHNTMNDIVRSYSKEGPTRAEVPSFSMYLTETLEKTHHMFTVGLDVDSFGSGMVVKLSLTTRLFAGNPRIS